LFRSVRLATLFVAASSVAVPVEGHHAFASEFDAARPITVEGTISKVEWVNPHSWLYVDVVMEDGATVLWMFESGTPTALVRHGLTHEVLAPGSVVTIQGYRSRQPYCNPVCRGAGHHIILADGRKIYIASFGAGTSDID